MIWTPRQDDFGQRTSICIKSISQTFKTTRNQISTVNSLPPTNRWNYRASKSRNWSIPLNILCLSSRRLATSSTHPRIHSQQSKACRQTEHLIFGESPVAIPLSFKSTKYPSMEDKMKTLLQNRQEALAAHKLARSQMTDRGCHRFTSPHGSHVQVGKGAGMGFTEFHRFHDPPQKTKIWTFTLWLGFYLQMYILYYIKYSCNSTWNWIKIAEIDQKRSKTIKND